MNQTIKAIQEVLEFQEIPASWDLAVVCQALDAMANDGENVAGSFVCKDQVRARSLAVALLRVDNEPVKVFADRIFVGLRYGEPQSEIKRLWRKIEAKENELGGGLKHSDPKRYARLEAEIDYIERFFARVFGYPLLHAMLEKRAYEG